MDINSFVIGYKKGKASGGGRPEGFHMVRFFNDDQTTLLYTVFVPTGASAMYAGEAPVSTVGGDIFRGFEPSPTNITADLDTYAVYEDVGTLDQTSWAKIAELSADGMAQNYFAVGETKMIHVEGTVGTLAVNDDFGVYIIGFDHNEELEGKGIHFGTFKTATSNGIDICLVDSNAGIYSNDGTKYFSMCHWSHSSLGGWRGCDMRYDILGSTDKAPSGYGSAPTSSRTGYDASESCATNPVANTLLSAFPEDLRAVLKPMVKYTDGNGWSSNTEANVVKTIDYLPLLAEFEVLGVRTNANQYEQNKQKQYDYFALGNSVIKYKHSSPDTWFGYWGRSAHYDYNSKFFSIWWKSNSPERADTSKGLAPIFKV